MLAQVLLAISILKMLTLAVDFRLLKLLLASWIVELEF